MKAVIFDLDGVITKTALVHRKAWKKVFDEYLKEKQKDSFNPFTDEDYLKYVDGKPRYNGVESFLKSRGINLPWGDPLDATDKETICGIGNRKNEYFLKLVREQGVEVYPSTISLIKELKKIGIKIGVASSSKNCKLILEVTGIEDLFETRVDGVISAQLGLKGKPNSDIFVQAAHNLKIEPAQAVVVEDASSGVAAGRNGAFGLVLGIARENNHSELYKYGADIVISDCSEISLEDLLSWFKIKPALILLDGQENKITSQPRSFPDCLGEKANPYYRKDINQQLKGNFAFFFDYDGTLTPIVARPELAILDLKMKDILQKLASNFPVAIISGRMKDDVKKMVNIENIFYAGSHGLDIQGPGLELLHPQLIDIVPLINELKDYFENKFSHIKGCLIEYKKFSIAIHYRLVEQKQDYLFIEQEVQNKLNKLNKLRLLSGKKVFELVPNFHWHKGSAVCWLIEKLNLNPEKNTLIYLGDDTTDEDAFRVLRTRGVSILVSEQDKISSADYRLASVSQVKDFLTFLA